MTFVFWIHYRFLEWIKWDFTPQSRERPSLRASRTRSAQLIYLIYPDTLPTFGTGQVSLSGLFSRLCRDHE